ncbi:sigma-70 family RNA polymerase sigma factor [Alteromonadaceae bacterium BrNp21-10]|nr:sigma-70 family RNA polymerase sigma factor [Alteromonadaceae bacterium BrNp21-10]
MQPTVPELLLEQIALGNKDAEKELVSNYWRGLTFVISRRCDDPDLVKDIVQDTLILVINKARHRKINTPSALNAFIRQVGINLLIGHFRKEARRQTYSDEDIDVQAPEEELSLSNALHYNNIVDLVQQVIADLPVERDREILRHHFIYDIDKTQICEDLVLSPEHFDRVLHRARTRLKQLITDKIHLAEPNKKLRLTLCLLLLMDPSSWQPSENSNVDFLISEMRDYHATLHIDSKAVQKSILRHGLLISGKGQLS